MPQAAAGNRVPADAGAPPVPQRGHRAGATGAAATAAAVAAAAAGSGSGQTQLSVATQLAAHIQTLPTDQFYEAYLEGHSVLVQPASLPESFVLGCKPAANSLLHLFGEWLFEAAVTGLRIEFKPPANAKSGG